MEQERILVVDDDQGLLHLLKMRLAAMGFDVTACTSGEDALDEARRQVFDLAITDLRLGGLDGVADTDATICLFGDTGTGKEVLARVIHCNSRKARGPFIALNCAAIPETLFESELFGHIKGAFTGASNSKRGLIQSASGGTLFLDEIGEMPLAMQVKLLRAIQEREVKEVGADYS